MNVRRRNRLITTVYAALACVPIAAVAWVLWQAEEGRRRGGAVARLAILAALVLVPVVWAEVRFRRLMREADAALRDAGIDPGEIPERPLPLVPRLRLAKDRDQLVAGALFLVLLTFVFVAYYAGWVGRLTGHAEGR
jgi:hypothetical protein